jgi:hypothetical protein
MSDSLRLPELGLPEIDELAPGGSDTGSCPTERQRVTVSLPVTALAEQVRFAFGEDEEKRIGERAGFPVWGCGVDGTYIHTHPVLGETNAVLAFAATANSIEAASAVIHTRSGNAPAVAYAIVLLSDPQALHREVLDGVIDRAVRAGGRYVGPEGAAVVAVIKAQSPSTLALALPRDAALASLVVLAVRPAADVVDHAYATWSDLKIVRAAPAPSPAIVSGLPAWVGDSAMLGTVFFDAAGLFDAAWYLEKAGNRNRPPAPGEFGLLKEYLTSHADPWWDPMRTRCSMPSTTPARCRVRNGSCIRWFIT